VIGYPLDAHDGDIRDDWPENPHSEGTGFAKEFARPQNLEYCALVADGTYTMRLAVAALDIGATAELARNPAALVELHWHHGRLPARGGKRGEARC
jgi:hypothetical protein